MKMIPIQRWEVSLKCTGKFCLRVPENVTGAASTQTGYAFLNGDVVDSICATADRHPLVVHMRYVEAGASAMGALCRIFCQRPATQCLVLAARDQ